MSASSPVTIKGAVSPVETYSGEHRLALAFMAFYFAACGLVALATGSCLFWLVFGLPALLFPSALVLAYPASFLTRLAVAAGCMAFVLLSVEQTNGYMEAHFSFFVMVTILAVYRDWRVLIFAAGLIIIHHVAFTIVNPRAVGFYVPGDDFAPWRHVLTHLSIGLLQVFTLCYITIMIRRREEQSAALGTSLDRAQKRADRDTQTGLFSRNYLEDQMGNLWFNAEGRQMEGVLCIIDIDLFKRVNDSYGHAAGDEVLRAVAETVRSQIRQVDCAVRYGGEEFVLVLPGTSIEDAGHVAERIRNRVAMQMISTSAATLSVTISIGAAASREHESFDALFKRADEALYLAKERGRNRVEVWSDTPEWTRTNAA